METDRLIQFIAVNETGNLRKAAKTLNMSHGALSKSLRVLESQLGSPLFQKNGRGLEITDVGVRLLDQSKEIVRLVQNLGGDSERRTLPETISFGTFELFSTYFLPKLVECMGDVALEVYEETPGRIEESTLSGKLDFGITLEPLPLKGIEFLKITQIEMGIYARTGIFKGMSFYKIPFAAPVNPISDVYRGTRGLDGWPEHEIPRFVKYRVDMIESALELARDGLCAIFIPKFFADLQNIRATSRHQLERMRSPRGLGMISRPVHIVKREASTESDAMKEAAKAIRVFCKTGPT